MRVLYILPEKGTRKNHDHETPTADFSDRKTFYFGSTNKIPDSKMRFCRLLPGFTNLLPKVTWRIGKNGVWGEGDREV